MIRPAQWSGETIYTQEQLAAIAQALQRPLSETCTRCLHGHAQQYRLASAQQAERLSQAQEQRRYARAVKHLQGVGRFFDQLEHPAHRQRFLDRCRDASPTREGGEIRDLLWYSEKTTQTLQHMCQGILDRMPAPRRGPPKTPLLDQPLTVFILQLAALYQRETSTKPTAYDHHAPTPFEQFVAACLQPFDPVRCNRSALYKTITRALREDTIYDKRRNYCP